MFSDNYIAAFSALQSFQELPVFVVYFCTKLFWICKFDALTGHVDYLLVIILFTGGHVVCVGECNAT